MLLGVVSDTHGQTDYTLDAVRMLESLEVDTVLRSAAMSARPTSCDFSSVGRRISFWET